MSITLALVAAVFIDALLGDPPNYPHPVRLIGWLISWVEKRLPTARKPFSAGMLLVFIVLSATVCATSAILYLGQVISSYCEMFFAVLLLYTTLAPKDLIKHGLDVQKALRQSDLILARKRLSMIVGRDTENLSKEQTVTATIETIAENMVDGVTAPIFYAVVASMSALFLPFSALTCAAVGAMVYKAINTMDSMVGYKNEKYLYFGRPAAYLDDWVNFIPARLSGVCLVAAAGLLGLDWRQSLEIFSRDRNKHSSPNAGHPEAAVAGALGLRLGGISLYFGKPVEKPFIGENRRLAVCEDIAITAKLMVYGSAIFLLLLLAAQRVVTGSW